MAQRKIFVLGSTGAGKTALIQRDHNAVSTKRIDFTVKTFCHNDKTIKLQAWDIRDCSEQVETINQYIARENNFCIVIDPLNPNTSIQKAEDYLNQIKTRASDHPTEQVQIQFVVTKNDLITQATTPYAELRQQFVNEINTLTNRFKGDCRNGNITNVTIFKDLIFCSATDPDSCDAVFNNFIAAFTAEDDESDEDSAGADTDNTPSKPWSTKKLYGWAKNILGIGLLATVGLILTSVFRSSLPDAIFTGMNAGFFGFIALCMVAALGTFIAAAVAKTNGDPGKNSDAKSHWFQIPFKVFAVIAVASLFGVAASAVYALPIISPALEIIKTAFSDINFPGLHAALPSELVATFAVVFVAAVSYLIIDAAFRFYNSRWNNHDPKIMPTVHPIAASIFNLNASSSSNPALAALLDGTDENNATLGGEVGAGEGKYQPVPATSFYGASGIPPTSVTNNAGGSPNVGGPTQ